MAGSPIKRARRDRSKQFLARKDVLAYICGRIASGPATLVDICREHDLHYGSINEWIQFSLERRAAYKDALAVREAHSKDHVIRELMGWIQADITQAFEENGTMKALADIPEDVRKFIAGLEVEELFGRELNELTGEFDRTVKGHLKKIKFYDKGRGLELIMKHLKMLVEQHTVEAGDTLAELLAAAGPRKLDGSPIKP